MAQEMQVRYEPLLDDVVALRAVPSEGNFMNMYLLGGKGAATLVDAAVPDAGAGLIDALKANGWQPQDLQRLVITHEHWDHYGAVPAVRAWAPHVQVVAHVYAAWMMTQRWTRFIVPGWPYGEPTPETFEAWQADQGMFLKVDGIVWNEATLEVADRPWRVLHTAGHAQGHIVLADEQRKVVLAGDVLQGVSDAKGWLGLYTDVKSQRESLARIRDLRPSLVLMGHHQPLRDRQIDEEIDRCIERLDVLADEVGRCVQAGQSDYGVLVRRAYERVFGAAPQEPPAHALRSVQAVLAGLCYEGKVRLQREDRWVWQG